MNVEMAAKARKEKVLVLDDDMMFKIRNRSGFYAHLSPNLIIIVELCLYLSNLTN